MRSAVTSKQALTPTLSRKRASVFTHLDATGAADA